MPHGKKTSGQQGPVPLAVKRWNWGAFFLTWIWIIGNRLWLVLGVALGCWLGYVGLVLIAALLLERALGFDEFACRLVLGYAGWLGWRVLPALKGNEWAWRYRRFESVAQFTQTQKAWQDWGWILFALNVVRVLINNAGRFIPQ